MCVSRGGAGVGCAGVTCVMVVFLHGVCVQAVSYLRPKLQNLLTCFGMGFEAIFGSGFVVILLITLGWFLPTFV